MRFEFATAHRIIFGAGTLDELGPAARALGRHALVVGGRDPTRSSRIEELLRRAGLKTTTVRITREPTTDDVVAAAEATRAAGCDLVVGCGGGSVLDGAKAIAGLAPNPGDVLEFLEVIGRARPLPEAALPCIAIPTTAGTGSEVTRNAVLASPTHRVKVSLRSPQLLPRLALVDPELTYDLPPALTASTGLDALTQLIEPFVSSRAQPFTDGICAEALPRAARSLRRAIEHGREAAAREDMAFASLAGGIALANAGLGAVHGFAGPIGGMFPAPHGAVCAALLPHVMAANVEALQARAPQHPARARYDQLARLLTGRPHAVAADGIAWVDELVRAVGIPPLRAYGVTTADVDPLVTAASAASSMKANPLPLTAEELRAVLVQAL